MDISKEYIKMCEKAEEIQKWTYKNRDQFDYMFSKHTEDVVRAIDIWCGLSSDDWIWLPRQDQLQEMIPKFKKDENIDLYWMLKALHDFQVLYTADLGIKSMEQLWLAFVMKEKYNKVWNGKDWKDIK